MKTSMAKDFQHAALRYKASARQGLAETEERSQGQLIHYTVRRRFPDSLPSFSEQLRRVGANRLERLHAHFEYKLDSITPLVRGRGLL